MVILLVQAALRHVQVLSLIHIWVIASGPGSASRQAIGTGVFFGMILDVTVGILLVPFFFVPVSYTHLQIDG